MPLIDNLGAFQECLPPSGSLLALDLSKRRIGLAGTDAGRSLVTPLHTLERARWVRDLARLQAVIRERQVVGLVVGWPLNMNGSAGPACQAVLATARKLEATLNLPILLQDERLTTSAVAFAIEEGRWPRPKRGEPVDHLAAAVILEDALRGLDRARHAHPDVVEETQSEGLRGGSLR
ncbi:MAG TPA: Holliday junction resolvase RuvX [Geminicoccaceae bacterium]|nr:Holliday junction resolvase RuvX [Geminicoccaceae bacterium]